MRTKRTHIFTSAISLLLCASMLLGTTWAWFTDSVTSTANIISTGTLKVELYRTSAAYPTPAQVTETTKDLFQVDLWEPGVATYENLSIKNIGSLWLQYKLGLNPVDVNYITGSPQFRLSEALKAGVVPGGIKDSNTDGTITREEAIGQVTAWKALNMVLEEGALAPSGKSDTVTGVPVTDTTEYGIVIWWEPTANDNNWNVNNGKTTSDGNPLTIDLGVTLAATQYTRESDSFGPDYDTTAQFPKLELPVKVTVNVPSENDATTQAVTMAARDVKATVPTGVQLVPGTQALTLSVTELAQSGANITTGATEDMVSMDVHVEGVADTNTTPIIVELGPVMPKYLNMGNYSIYHVENGATNPMTLVGSLAELDAHNEFIYDVNTGNLTVAMATFSEVAIVADTGNTWNGEYDFSWYDADAEVLTISNADQLAGLSAIVGGMAYEDGNKEETVQDSFAGKTVKLIASIDIGDTTDENDVVFYPIGYTNTLKSYTKQGGVAVTSGVESFEGTFDGQGHTIKNFYQNTWEMFGDYNDGYSGTPNHYKDAMGLFGYVYNGTVKNLNVENFQSDGEFTPTGVIAAYACNSTFENIAITDCNPRVYNTGNGGIVGIGGNSDDPDTYKLTFTNITIDNSNKITALWGSWDVACGGLVGMFRGAGHVYMTNCHVAAQIDVYNDVCGNYQYYWYRYAGMLVGTNKNMVTVDGRTKPETEKFHATNCTVHFGDWNDYYYCELVENTQASYTHDHQMSRLEEVKAVNGTNITYLDGSTGAVPVSGRYNYVVVNGAEGTENATCYHFKNGEVWNHEDGGIQTGIDENGDGQDDLKEDKQHIYLPFNQLFTGYGWGVEHMPIYDDGKTDFAGVKILDRTETNSAQKFTVKSGAAAAAYTSGSVVTVGDLFNAVDAYKNDIQDENVQVTVSPAVGTGSTAGGVYYPNTSDWDRGVLVLSGTGKAVITITDYYFCTPTTLNVTVEAAEPAQPVTINLNSTTGSVRLYATQAAAAGATNVPFVAINGFTSGGQEIKAGATVLCNPKADLGFNNQILQGGIYTKSTENDVAKLLRVQYTTGSDPRMGLHNNITGWEVKDGITTMYAGDAHVSCESSIKCNNDFTANPLNVNEVKVAQVAENVTVAGVLTSKEDLAKAVMSGCLDVEVDYWCDKNNSSKVVFIYVRSLTQDKDNNKKQDYVPANGEVVCLPWGHGKGAADQITDVRSRECSAVVLQHNMQNYGTLVQWVYLRFHKAQVTLGEGEPLPEWVEPGFYQTVYCGTDGAELAADTLPAHVIALKSVGTVVTYNELMTYYNSIKETEGIELEYLGAPDGCPKTWDELVKAGEADGEAVKVSYWLRPADVAHNLPEKLLVCGHSIVKAQ